jgi:hypothetical protein
MQVKTRIKAEGMPKNHNEARVRVQKPTQGLKVKTGIKAGCFFDQPPVPGSGASALA